MQLTVKTLKGGKFTIEVEPSNTVAEAKAVIETTKSELPAANMKLIHSGKVLKDDATIESCNIKPSDFLVVMIAKAKKTAAAAAAAPKPAAPKEEVKPAAVAAAPPAAAASTAASTTTTAAAPAPSATTTESSSAEADEFPTEVINNLKALGFPESDCRACLRASNGNPDVAVEFLMNGIPPGISAAATTAAGSSSAGPSSTATTTTTGTGALEALRHHPQFNDLKRLVQTNPNMLSAVLQQIGQQQPELLQAINANQAEFLQMMNEPVGSTGGSGGLGGGGAANPAPAAGANNNNPFSGSSGSASNAGMPPGMEALGNPAQLAAMLQSMPPQEQHAMASMMGMTVDQLQQTAQMISAMPQEQVQQYMNMAMQGAGGPGMGGMMGGAGGMGGGGGAGAQVLRLSEEEMAAVNRLTEMGFDRAAAAQAYLACDKNEALAANLLMDGGFADFGDDGADMGGGGGGGGDDDMYD